MILTGRDMLVTMILAAFAFYFVVYVLPDPKALGERLFELINPIGQ